MSLVLYFREKKEREVLKRIKLTYKIIDKQKLHFLSGQMDNKVESPTCDMDFRRVMLLPGF